VIQERRAQKKKAARPTLVKAFDGGSLRDSEGTVRAGVCTENFIRVDDAPESPKLAE
jgi:hypothetical protein